jgi:thiol:disulfide interchange protein DsbA
MSLRKMLALATSLLALAFAAQAQQNPPYATLSPPQPIESSGKIEVTEFFWYGCPHCYHLEPELVAWVKKLPPDVVFKRVHAYPSAAWGAHASIYYTLETMGLVDKLHQKVFDAIHKENLNLANAQVLKDWLTKNGVDAAKYAEVEKSFSVASKLQRARQMTAQYKVDGVPRLFVNGRWYTAPEFAGERTFAVVDQLIAMARKESAPAAVPAAAKK